MLTATGWALKLRSIGMLTEEPEEAAGFIILAWLSLAEHKLWTQARHWITTVYHQFTAKRGANAALSGQLWLWASDWDTNSWPAVPSEKIFRPFR